MKKQLYWLFPIISLLLFVIWTVLLLVVDVQDIAGISQLGFSTLNLKFNNFVHDLGNSLFGIFSDVLLYASFATVVPFAIIGVTQLVKRKSLLKVDRYIYFMLLGYVLAVVFYFLFNLVVVNYSPNSSAGDLKPSYPSSHVLLAVSFYLIAYMGFNKYASASYMLKMVVFGASCGIAFITVLTRAFSGEHYLSDIIGGLLLAIFIILLVFTLFTVENKRLEEVESHD